MTKISQDLDFPTIFSSNLPTSHHSPSFILEFLISSLGVQPVLWESLADSSASGKQNLCRFGSEVVHHMESLILLQLIDKAAIGMCPHNLVTDGMVFGGWLYSPEYNLL